MLRKIAFIIGLSFAFYASAEPSKVHYDLCFFVFTLTILILHFENVKDRAYSQIVMVAIASNIYSIAKELLGLGTTYVWSDYVMWIVVPISVIAIIIIDAINYYNNGTN